MEILAAPTLGKILKFETYPIEIEYHEFAIGYAVIIDGSKYRAKNAATFEKLIAAIGCFTDLTVIHGIRPVIDAVYIVVFEKTNTEEELIEELKKATEETCGYDEFDDEEEPEEDDDWDTPEQENTYFIDTEMRGGI